jgi:uncharacterized glyoxalase superfamily protein PhnB
MKLIYTWICVLLVTTAGAQIDIIPYRIGIVVDNVKIAEQWYQQVLEFRTYKEMELPQYDSLRIRFMRQGNFEIELVQKHSSFSIESLQPGYDINARPLQGFVKVAFKVADVQGTFNRIKQRGAEIILPVTYDKEFNVDFFIIEDPDGNMLQFIGPPKTTR